MSDEGGVPINSILGGLVKRRLLETALVGFLSPFAASIGVMSDILKGNTVAALMMATMLGLLLAVIGVSGQLIRFHLLR